jgi:hypothetical protein
MRCESAEELPDDGFHSPSAERNKGPILKVLKRMLPKAGLVLEIASGTGEHVVHFARALKGLIWQPSEADADCRRSISAWLAAENLRNARQPLDLDVPRLPRPVPALDAIVCIYLIHIALWAVTKAFLFGGKMTLREAGLLYLCGRSLLRSSGASDSLFRR